jgi:predicted pyridoxine 5'-phosphate oxidase superfamily flavin-nucleotide-binding protein
MAIEFTEDMVNALNNSRADGMLVTVATAGAAGVPDIAMKGSVMAFDKDHIAYWERALGTTFRNLKENPNVCLFYRNMPARQVWKFFGVAEVHTEGAVRQRVMDRTIEAELNMDPERKGAGIVIRIDKITQGPQVLQER